MLEVTDQNFETEVLRAKGLVAVDFWAPWCAPCKNFGLLVEALAKEYDDQGVCLVKMNVDENHLVPERFGIRSIPALLFFQGGQVVDQIIGSVSREALRDRIEQHRSGSRTSAHL